MPNIPTTRGNPEASDIAVETVLPFIGNVSRDDLQMTLSAVDAEMAKLFEDRNILLTQGGTITFSGTLLTFTESLKLELNSKIAGGSPVVIDLTGTPKSLANDGDMFYVIINRTAGTASTATALTLPAVTSANQEVFLIAKRRDAGDGTQRCYFRNGMALNAGQAVRLGSAGSGGGNGSTVNLIGLNVDYQPTNSNDINAENNIGNWLRYNDGASTQPVDMTAGALSGNLTFTRTALAGQVLNGSGSFLMTKSGTISTQGEGVSVLVNVPPGYRGQTATIQFPWKLHGGSLVQNDLKVFLYDLTNTAILVPFNNDIVGNQGILTATVPIAINCVQLRIGIHVASTTTSNINISFDDVFLGTVNAAIGYAGTNWKNDLVFTTSAFGTITETNYWYRRVGDSMEIRANWRNGTVTGSQAQFILPTGYLINVNKLSSQVNRQQVGTWVAIRSAANTFSGANNFNPMFYDGSTNNILWFSAQAEASNQFTKDAASTVSGSTHNMIVNITIPIEGWDSNVTVVGSSTFNISSYLANGTRITGTAPTLLGQYRSYLRNAGALTFTETNGAPVIAPSASDGIKLYNGNSYASADTNNEPTKYDIFVGKNKNVKFVFNASAGRTGFIDTDPVAISTLDLGYFTNYDPTTGIASIVGHRTGTGSTHGSGIGSDGGSVLNDPFFDLVVSENALAVGVQAPRSEVYVYGGNGHGSVDDKVRRFTTLVVNKGTAITYTESAANGSQFRINEDGVYSMGYSDAGTTGASEGITRNSPFLTTGVSDSSQQPYRLISTSIPTVAANQPSFCGVTTICSAGDIIRAMNDSSTSPNGTVPEGTTFRICKVSN